MTPAERKRRYKIVNGPGVRQSLPDANPDTGGDPTFAATPISDTKVAPVPLGDDVPSRRGKGSMKPTRAEAAARKQRRRRNFEASSARLAMRMRLEIQSRTQPRNDKK